MIRLSIDIDTHAPTLRAAIDKLNESVGAALDELEDDGVISGWAYSVETLRAIISGSPRIATHHEQITNWINSFHELHSRRLSEIGIDDQGDLMDEVPAFREWIDSLLVIIEGWGQ